jgi:hypothetical protein
MPRGGGHKADGYSPYKHSNGRELKILKSSKSSNGYHRVVEQHKGKFYPKISIETGNGKKKQKVFGTASPTAREAAIKLAIYEDEPYELPVAPPRGPPSEKKVEEAKWRRLEKLQAEARTLLGIESEEDEPPLPQLVRAPDGELMVCVDAVEGAAAGAPTVAFSPL